MTMREALARREAIRTEMRALHAAAENGPLAGEAQGRWDTLTAELGSLEAQQQRQAALDDLDRRAAGQPLEGDRRFDQLTDEIRLSDVVAATLGEQTRGAGAAREASQEIARQRGKSPTGLFVSQRALRRAAEQRALTSGAQGTPPTGAPLVPTYVRGDLRIDPLRAATVIDKLGATYLTGLTGNISVPRVTQGTSVGWFAENAPIPDTDATFDSVPLQVKHVGAITEYSRNMLLNSTPDVDALLRTDLMRALAVEVDRAALAGTGDGIQPRGIINTVGVTKVPFGGALSWQNVLALPASLDNANVLETSPGFVSTGKFRAAAMRTLAAPGVASQFLMEELGLLAGYPFYATNQIPNKPATTGANATPATTTLVFGAWSNLLVAVWDALDLTSNPWADSVYRKGSVQIRIIADVDVAVRHPEAFAFADDVGT